MSLPNLLSEDQVRAFSYYWEGSIRSGMAVQGRLYALLDCYPVSERVKAFEKGCELSDSHDVVLTVSNTQKVVYRLWIALAADTHKSLLSQALQFCECSDEPDRGGVDASRDRPLSLQRQDNRTPHPPHRSAIAPSSLTSLAL